MEYHIIDIETGIAPDAKRFMPKFEYRWKKQHTKQDELVDIKIQENEWLQQAALQSHTAQILCIGHMYMDGKVHIDGFDAVEEQVLEAFWDRTTQAVNSGQIIVGHNIRMFDFPMIIRRSWKYKIKIPSWVYQVYDTVVKCKLSNFIVDTSDIWLLDDEIRYHRFQGKPNWDDRLDVRAIQRWGQDIITQHLGGTPKPFDGKNFQKVWEKDKAAAITYLTNDLMQVKWNFTRMMQIEEYEMPF